MLQMLHGNNGFLQDFCINVYHSITSILIMSNNNICRDRKFNPYQQHLNLLKEEAICVLYILHVVKDV